MGGCSSRRYFAKDNSGTYVRKTKPKRNCSSDDYTVKHRWGRLVSRRRLNRHNQSNEQEDHSKSSEISKEEKMKESQKDGQLNINIESNILPEDVWSEIESTSRDSYESLTTPYSTASENKSLCDSDYITNDEHISFLDDTATSGDSKTDVTLLMKENTIYTEGTNGKSTSSKLKLDLGYDEWEGCLSQSDFEQCAKCLLKEGKIPDNRLLETICSRYNRKSNIVQLICHHICSYLKTLSNSIMHIWPAYKYDKSQTPLSNENKIVFVLITSQHIELKTEFNTYQRRFLDISPICKRENRDIDKKETKSKLPDKVAEDLKVCLKANARTLMKNHSNLNRVSLSWVKGSGYATEIRSLKESPCITLYVHIKGFVPLGEEPFSEHIQDFEVDVREGVFELCGPPNDFHQNVKMGCAIDTGYGTNQGTVGPFVQYELDSHMYYITSAHVALDSEQIKRLIEKKNIFFGELGSDTYQPPESESSDNNSRHPLGKTVLAVYKEGNETEAGVEFALVRIKDDRIPSDCTFPDSPSAVSDEFPVNNRFESSTGEISESWNSLLQTVTVYKFGSISGLTKGNCRLNANSSVRTGTLCSNNLGFDITLHGQIEISDSESSIPFGKQGDSGSLVFTKQGECLEPVGIFEGKMDNTYFVTPINDILQELSVLSRNRKLSKKDDKAKDTPIALKVKYSEPMHITGHQLDTNNATTELTEAQQNLETNIAHFTDHKINSMKTEITTIKNELVQKMDEMEDNVTKKVTENMRQQFEEFKNFFRGQPTVSLNPNA